VLSRIREIEEGYDPGWPLQQLYQKVPRVNTAP